MDDQQAAEEAGDVVSHEVPVISDSTVEETQEVETTQEQEDEPIDDTKWKISQKKWQEMVESSKNSKQLLKKVAELFDIETDELPEASDLMGKLQKEIKTLKEQTARKDWEADHPEVRKEKYSEQWSEIVKKKGHLVQSGDLTYDELFAIIRKDSPSATPREFTEQQRAAGSVPPASKTPMTSGMDSEVEAMLRKALPDVPPEMFK